MPATRKRLALRDWAASAIVFAVILFALVSVDPRVKAQVDDSLRTSTARSLSHRASDMGGTVWLAAQEKSMDRAPVLIFAAVGAVLTLFMLRT